MKYQVNGQITISCYTEVEANSPEEAIAIANQRGNCSIHVCGGEESDDVWMADDLDGQAEATSVEEKDNG